MGYLLPLRIRFTTAPCHGRPDHVGICSSFRPRRKCDRSLNPRRETLLPAPKPRLRLHRNQRAAGPLNSPARSGIDIHRSTPAVRLNLPQVIVAELLWWRGVNSRSAPSQAREWKEGNFVFTTGIGTPIEPRNVTRAFDEIVAGLPRIRDHDLRHAAATPLLAKGVHPRVVMGLMEHSQIAVTMRLGEPPLSA